MSSLVFYVIGSVETTFGVTLAKGFRAAFHHQEVYGIDRLIGAANMFDILPKSAIPRKVVLFKELASTKARGEIFRRSTTKSVSGVSF